MSKNGGFLEVGRCGGVTLGCEGVKAWMLHHLQALRDEHNW